MKKWYRSWILLGSGFLLAIGITQTFAEIATIDIDNTYGKYNVDIRATSVNTLNFEATPGNPSMVGISEPIRSLIRIGESQTYEFAYTPSPVGDTKLQVYIYAEKSPNQRKCHLEFNIATGVILYNGKTSDSDDQCPDAALS